MYLLKSLTKSPAKKAGLFLCETSKTIIYMQTLTKQSWRFSESAKHIPKSFIREILKITAQPDVISFAGGLPNPSSFPVEAIKQCTIKVLESDGKNALQYAPSEGYLPLRKYIAESYSRKGMDVSVDEILITNGSQQG